jgi:hypothetical protein
VEGKLTTKKVTPRCCRSQWQDMCCWFDTVLPLLWLFGVVPACCLLLPSLLPEGSTRSVTDNDGWWHFISCYLGVLWGGVLKNLYGVQLSCNLLWHRIDRVLCQPQSPGLVKAFSAGQCAGMSCVRVDLTKDERVSCVLE